jgi:chromosome segregation ATPase
MISIPSFKKRQSANGSSRGSNDTQSTTTPSIDAAALQALVERAERAEAALAAHDAIVERGSELAAMDERISGLDLKIQAAEAIQSKLAEVSEQADDLSESQDRANSAIATTESELERVASTLSDLLEKVDAAQTLGEDFEKVAEVTAEFASLKGEAGTIRSQIRDLFDNVIRLRTVHDDVLRAHKQATIRLEGVDQRQQATATKMDVLERRAATAEDTLTSLGRLASEIPDVQHQLGVLKSISDQVAQRTAAIEQQRDAVERAITQSSQVVALGGQFDAALQRQEEHTRSLSALERKLGEVQSLHASVLARSAEISAQQRQLDEAERDAGRELAGLREEMRASAERFELENKSLDAASERIAELRGFVNDCEKRFGGLDAAARLVAETDTRARVLASQVTKTTDDVSRITVQAERLRVVRDDVGKLDEALAELTDRMQHVESARPLLEEVSRELKALNGAQESIRDGLEQVRAASTEMSRLRERQTGTDAWLSDADERMKVLRGHVEQLERTAPAIDVLREQVQRVSAATDAIENRGSAVDDLHRRVVGLETNVSQLDERSTSVRTRMDAAESRFSDLARQAADAQRVAGTIGSVTAAVDSAERRMDSVNASVEALEDHAERVDELRERMRLLGQEVDQRQGALDKAAEHLNRASEMRREAADAARELEEVSRAIATQLEDAGSKTGVLGELAHELEGRAASLGDIDKRMGELEELLGRSEVAQKSASQALEQIMGRQATVDAVHAQVKHVFEIAERTSADVKSIAVARQDIEEARTKLEDMRERVQGATDSMRTFEERRRQIEELEQRLARADAISRDVRSTIEMISAQRSVVDLVLERSGTLVVQSKQAEALIEVLRAECSIASTLKGSIQGLREQRETEVTVSGVGHE